MDLEVTSVLWKQHVEDRPVTADDFQLANSIIDPQQMADSDILVELLYLSVDPYMRGMMRDAQVGSTPCAWGVVVVVGYYRQPFEPGQLLSSRGIARVKKAGPGVGSGFEEGDVLSGMLPWSSHAVLGRRGQGRAQAQLQLVDSRLLGRVPLPCFLGALGMPGLTAWAGLRRIAQPVAGQLLKGVHGCTVIGSAGSDEKMRIGFRVGGAGLTGQQLKCVYSCTVINSAGNHDQGVFEDNGVLLVQFKAGDSVAVWSNVAMLKQHGFDAAFNYKTSSTAEALQQAAPDGIDIYFDNVGGPTLDAALEAARPHARVVACGAISQYDLPQEQRYGVKNLLSVITKRIKLQGFVVGDYAAEIARDFHEDMSQHVLTGTVKALQHVTHGLENAGAAFVGMMGGGNIGKAVVQVVQQDPHPVVQQQQQ
ncbi:NADPH dependent alkenal/alkenone reductase [Scenedesmus sp. NREL 46B-D3]|nr:NADPH dependent alkenal/alkenone reductase [Scenedesmus sp. NREL 46B-D3]